MAIMIPLRVTTALIGLLVGYYAGKIVEYKWKCNSTVAALVNTLNTAYCVSEHISDYCTDDEEDFICFCTTCSGESDEDTDYSQQEDSCDKT